ncbi:MAG: hypothetical protein JO022_13815 [Acidobacteriaceae bacterium]|nr:hypothetical protein [Acidobacteriaceae bacterium]
MLSAVAGFVVGSSLARSSPLAENSLRRYVHPNSKALVGAQWSKIQKSELGRWLQRRWINNLDIPGTEFLKDVDEVLISSPGLKDGAGEDEDPALLIAIHGSFNLTRVRLVLARQGARMQNFDGIPVYRLKGKTESDPAFALLNSQTILVGDPQSLFSTIERSKLVQNTDESGPFTARAQAMAARYDCWALAGENGSIHNFLLSALVGKALSPESQGFEAGISVRDGLLVDVIMKVPSERAAKLLQNNLARLIRIAGTPMGAKNNDFVNLIPKFRVRSDKESVSLSLRMSDSEIAAALHANSDRFVAQTAAVPGEAERRTATLPRSAPPAKSVIRIEGLDEGPRELPFKP